MFWNELTKVDLREDDTVYEAVDAAVAFSDLDGVWRLARPELDCAIRGHGWAIHMDLPRPAVRLRRVKHETRRVAGELRSATRRT